MLPIPKIGGMLSKGQWTEELPHDTDDAAALETAVKFNHPFLPPSNYVPVSSIVETKARAYIHHSEQIPSNHSNEVVTPPPDSVS